MCAACEVAVPRLPAARCRVCALPVAGADVCGACLKAPPRYDLTLAVFTYAFPLDALVQALKFGDALAEAVASEPAEVIVPMPLSVARLRERGFNQALEIARHVGRATGIPVAPEACRRVLDTAAQATLPWKARAANIRGAFVCDANLSGRRVAIVDDVMTTGATLDELAKNVRRAGAREIRAWVVARALRHGEPYSVKL